MNIEFCGVLFISHEYGYRRATKIPFLTDFVLKEAAIWLLHPLRKIAEEYECWNHRLFKHRHILDFHKFALVARRRGHGNLLKHVSVKLRGRDNSLAIVVDLYGCLKHLENSLLCDSRRKQDGEICERREFIADGIFKMLLSGHRLVGHKVPLVHTHHQALPVALYEREDACILALDTTGGVNHKNTHVACLD